MKIATGTVIAGRIAQVVASQDGALATGTTTIPFDDTIPQNTEGNEYMTLAITPKVATSTLIIDVVWIGASSVSNNISAVLFQDSTADALAAGMSVNPNANQLVTIGFRHTMTSGTTSSTTFKVRAGGSGAATTTFNGSGGARLYGGVIASSIRIREVLQP